MASITAGGTRDSFLKALTHVTGEIVQYATLVRANILEMDLKENEEKYREVAIDKFFYLCFGRHALFFVDRMMKGRDDSEGVLKRVPYVAIQQLRIDPEESCLLCIEFKGEDDGRPRDVPPNVYLHVMCRDEVLTQLQVSWKTDYIMQKFEIKGFPGVVRDHELSNTWSKHWETISKKNERLPSSWANQGVDASFIAAPPNHKLMQVGAYTFFCPAEYDKAVVSGAVEIGHWVLNQKKSRDGSALRRDLLNQSHFYIRVGKERRISKKFSDTIEDVATRFMHEIGDRVVDYRVMETPRRYNKRFNLTGDPASWDAFKICLRTSNEKVGSTGVDNRDVIIIACRRRYFPPLMDVRQDMVLVFLGKRGQFAEIGSKQYETMLDKPEMIVNSLSPLQNSSDMDLLVMQTKADALLLDEETYGWYQAHLNIVPTKAVKYARLFCMSLMHLIGRTGGGAKAFKDVKSLSNVFGDVVVSLSPDQIRDPDPFHYARLLEKQADGLSHYSAPVYHQLWKRRVWRYLAYCVDGGLLPGILKLEIVVYNYKIMSGFPAEQALLAKLLDTMLRVRPIGAKYTDMPLPSLLENDLVMRRFTCNHAVLERLLEFGYIREALSRYSDSSEYPRFLVRLLLRFGPESDECRRNIVYAVCRRLYALSMESYGAQHSNAGRSAGVLSSKSSLRQQRGGLPEEITVATVIPMLIRILDHDDEKVKVLAVASLVNFTRDNGPMKNVVMANGSIRRISRFLSSKHEDLVRHSCSLLYNCSSSEQYRQTIESFGTVDKLMKLITPAKFGNFSFRKYDVLINATAVLCNLALDAQLREKMSALVDSNGKPHYVISALCGLLERKCKINLTGGDGEVKGEMGGDTSKLQKLRGQVVLALRYLCVRHAENKREVGKRALPYLLYILKDKDVSKPLLSTTLSCLYVVSHDNDTKKSILHADDVEGILDKHQKDEDLSKIVRSLRRVLARGADL